MYGMAVLMGALTDSFTLLRRLAMTFEEAGSLPAKHRRSALRWAVALGKTAVPMCARELSESVDEVRTAQPAPVELRAKPVVKTVELQASRSYWP